MDKIKKHRERIDRLDEEIMRLLDERFTLSKQIGHLKAASSHPVLDKDRETTILDRAAGHTHEDAIKEVYQALMNTSKKLQKKG